MYSSPLGIFGLARKFFGSMAVYSNCTVLYSVRSIKNKKEKKCKKKNFADAYSFVFQCWWRRRHRIPHNVALAWLFTRRRHNRVIGSERSSSPGLSIYPGFSWNGPCAWILPWKSILLLLTLCWKIHKCMYLLAGAPPSSPSPTIPECNMNIHHVEVCGSFVKICAKVLAVYFRFQDVCVACNYIAITPVSANVKKNSHRINKLGKFPFTYYIYYIELLFYSFFKSRQKCAILWPFF